MRKVSWVFVICAIVLFGAGFFLPSILFSHEFSTILDYWQAYPVDYMGIFILLFPLVVVLVILGKNKISFYLSIALIYINNDLFEDIIAMVFGYLNAGSKVWLIPAFIGLVIIGWVLVKEALKNRNLILYGIFILFAIVFYYFTIAVNCRFYFELDVAFITNDIAVWFENCGSYYAWWTSGIVLNIGIFLKLIKNLQEQD